jgi:hypothetical protein
MRLLVVATGVVFLVLACGSVATAQRSYLAAWSGDADREHSDFLAIVDVDPQSPHYGRVVASLPVGERSTRPHHVEHSFTEGHTLFASGFNGNRLFRFDLADPLRPRLAGAVELPSTLAYPHSLERLATGNVVAAMHALDGTFQPPGGIAEFADDGTVTRWASAETASVPGNVVRPYSLAVVPAYDRLVTTSGQMGLARWDSRRDNFANEPAGFHIQLWRLTDFTLLATAALSSPDGSDAHLMPYEPRVLEDGSTVLVVTARCGLYLVGGLDVDSFDAELIHEFEGRGCAVPLRVGRFWVQTTSETRRVVVLDVSDPTQPFEVSRLQFDERQAPHWLAFDDRRQRIVVVNHEGGEPRMWMVDFDISTGEITLDDDFRGNESDRAGVSFDRAAWPHGPTGPAFPHGTVFVQD